MFLSLIVFLLASQATAETNCNTCLYSEKDYQGVKKCFSTSSSTSVSTNDFPHDVKSARYSYNCAENMVRKDIANCFNTQTPCPREIKYYEDVTVDMKGVRPCKALTEDPLIEEALERRVRICQGVCGVFVPIAGVLAGAIITPAALFAMGPIAAGCAMGCVRRACEHGLVGNECVKFGGECDPNGLRCCDNFNGKQRVCKKVGLREKYKCRNP
jgi:hypothetical protein